MVNYEFPVVVQPYNKYERVEHTWEQAWPQPTLPGNKVGLDVIQSLSLCKTLMPALISCTGIPGRWYLVQKMQSGGSNFPTQIWMHSQAEQCEPKMETVSS